MKVRKPPQSGSLGDIVAKKNRYGQYETKKPSAKYRHTPARRRACANMTKFSRLWNELTAEQQDGWRRRALEVRSQPRLAQSGPLTGHNLFVRINTVLATCGCEPLLEAPPIPQFSTNPVVGLTIRDGPDGLVLKLRLSERPTQDIMVFASPPRSRGQVFCETYAFLGLLPDSVEHESEITRLYLKKYGVPPAGSRIFIRTWPQENGWEAKGLRRITYADVPPRDRASGQRTGRRARVKRG